MAVNRPIRGGPSAARLSAQDARGKVQNDAETGGAALRWAGILEVDGDTMPLGDLAGNGQAEPRAVGRLPAVAIETLEHPLAQLRRDAAAAVFDLNPGPVARPHPDGHRPSRWRVPQRIIEQVGEHLVQQHRLPADDRGLAFESEVNASPHRLG